MLNEFREYLLRKGPIKLHHIPYYLKRVADCYAFLDAPDSSFINSDQKQRFLTHMAKNHEDWQVKQADTALRLYHYFLSQQLRASTLDVGTAGEWTVLFLPFEYGGL